MIALTCKRLQLPRGLAVTNRDGDERLDVWYLPCPGLVE